MRVLIAIFLNLFILQSSNEPLKQIFLVKFKENIQLKGYEVRQTFKFTNDQMFVVAKESFETGYQLIYLTKKADNEIYDKSFVSDGKGEAYVYNPYFYEATDNEFIIVAEEGYEYMSGIDIYSLKNGQVKFLGYVPVSGDQRGSVIPKLRIEKQRGSYEMLFKGTIEYEIATDRLIDGSGLKVQFNSDEFEIIEN